MTLLTGPVVRTRLGAIALVSVEVWFLARYAAAGAVFHFWLHALLGGALGLWLLALVQLRRPVRTAVGTAGGSTAGGVRPAEATLAGHLLSAVPDVLFLLVGVLHVAWMDVFVVHITAHFLWPSPLGVALALWVLAVLAWTAVRLGARRVAAGALLGSVAVLGVAVLLRAPLPTTLAELTGGDRLGAAAWVCRVDP